MIKRVIIFLTISMAMIGANPSQSIADEAISFPKIGKIKTKSAHEIRASNWSVGAETMDRDYTIYSEWKSYLGPLGFKKARIQAGWAKTERTRGVYDWKWLDEIIFDMDKQGVEPWMCLCYGNSIYADGGGTRLGAGIPQTEESMEAWCRWVKANVARYGEVIDEWEVWNEPNLRNKNQASAYAEFLILTAEAVRLIQPHAKILAMAMAGVKVKFTDEVLSILSQRDKLDLIDEITYHPYSYNPDDRYDDVIQLRKTIARYSDRISIRQGENGAPSERRKTKALSNYDWTELSQAKWALRRLLGDLGRDIPSSYFAIMDMKYPDEINRKGLLKSTESQEVERPKQAYYALQYLASIFDDRLERIPNYSYEVNSDKSLSLFAYQDRVSKGQLVTIWQDGDTPSDSIEKDLLDFTFHNGCFSKPVFIDLRTGVVYEIPTENVEKRGTVYHFNSIPCYDSPILIADRDAIEMTKE